NGADDQRPENSDRHVAVRVLGLLRRSGNRVEPNVSEKDDSGAAQNAAPAELSKMTLVRRNERMPVRKRERRVPGEEDNSQADEDKQNRHFDDHDRGVEVRGFADPFNQYGGHDEDADQRHQVEM